MAEDKQTIITPPNPPAGGGGGAGWAVAIIILIIIALVLVFAIPIFRRNSGVDLNVPENINVDVDRGGNGETGQ